MKLIVMRFLELTFYYVLLIPIEKDSELGELIDLPELS